MPKSKSSPDWVKAFRKAIKQTCPIGWSVINDRNRVRLQVGKRGNIKSINLPYTWSETDWIDAFKRIEVAANIYLEHNEKIDIKTAFQIAAAASNKSELNWHESIKKFRTFKTRVKDSTWKTKYKPVLERTLEICSKKRKATNGPQLCELVLNKWVKGTSQRRHMRLSLYGFLNFCVHHQDFPSVWLPPALTDEEVVTKPKRVGFPLTDSQIIRLIEGLPNTNTGNRWRFAIELCSVFGLRPEDLRAIYTKKNGQEIWSDYRKSKGGSKGETTEPRQLFPLWVLDSDGTPADWNYTLKARVAAGEALPPLGKPGKAGEALGTFLRRQSIWKQLRTEAQKEKEELTPYSFRHRFAYYGHNRQQEDGTYRSPKQVADALGHSLDTHLLSYARFNTRELAKSFDQQPVIT